MKNLLLVVFALCLAFSSYSQNSTTKKSESDENKNQENKHIVIIEQSILDPEDSIPNYIRQNSNIILKFYDVNTFLYKVEFKELQRDVINNSEISNNSFDINSRVSEFRINEVSLDIPFPEVNSQSLSVIKEINLTEAEMLAVRKDVHNKGEEIFDTEQKVNQQPEWRPKKSIDSLENEQANLETKYEKLDAKLDSLIRQLPEESVVFFTLNSKMNEYRRYAVDLNNLVDLYMELLKLMYSQKPFSTIESEKEALLNGYFKTDDVNLILRSCNEKLEKLEDAYYSIYRTLAENTDKESLKKNLEKFSNFHKSINKTEFNRLFFEISKAIYAISPENWTLTYQTTKVSDKADRLAYSIKFTPTKNTFNNYSVPMKYDYIFPIKGGWKFDISAGLMWHFNLWDDQLRLKSTSDSTTQLINDRKFSSVIPSAAALLNVYWRSNRNVKLALNIGVGSNVQDLYYYFGGGLLLGRSERVAINGGIVIGQVKTISTEFSDGQTIDRPISELEVSSFYQPIDPWRYGWFVGITYNLTGSNKDSVDKMFGSE